MRNNLNTKHILVTGGAGYIGSHTAKALAKAGYTPVVFDNFSFGHPWAVKWGPCVEGDLADRELIAKTLRDYSIQGVIHFAAFAFVGESVEDPKKYFRNNTVNTLNLLEAMLEQNIKKFIFSSTAATYGTPEASPIPEDTVQKPINPYGESKLFIEKILGWFDQAYGMKFVAPRYFNACGADPEGEIGEDHTPETHLIPLIIQAAMGQRDCIRIFGTDYPTSDGTAIRDYIHVTDLADAHVLALRYLEKGNPSLRLNLGTGKGYSVREVIGMVEHVCGREIPKKEVGRRAGDPTTLVAKVDQAESILGWRPRYSSLETIVQTAWNWHQKIPA